MIAPGSLVTAHGRTWARAPARADAGGPWIEFLDGQVALVLGSRRSRALGTQVLVLLPGNLVGWCPTVGLRAVLA